MKVISIFILNLILSKSNFVSAFCGSFLDLKASFCLKSFLNSYGCFNIYSSDIKYSCSDYRFFFQLNTTIEDLESKFNILFLGLNLRLEAPLLNSRLRKSYLNKSFNVYSIGLSLKNTTFPIINFGIVFQFY